MTKAGLPPLSVDVNARETTDFPSVSDLIQDTESSMNHPVMDSSEDYQFPPPILPAVPTTTPIMELPPLPVLNIATGTKKKEKPHKRYTHISEDSTLLLDALSQSTENIIATISDLSSCIVGLATSLNGVKTELYNQRVTLEEMKKGFNGLERRLEILTGSGAQRLYIPAAISLSTPECSKKRN